MIFDCDVSGREIGGRQDRPELEMRGMFPATILPQLGAWSQKSKWVVVACIDIDSLKLLRK